MSPKKFDGIVEAVRYGKNGSIETVRVYERRGPTFTDRVLLDRQAFVTLLKTGKHYMIGHPIPYRASDFEVSLPVRLETVDGQEFVIAGDQKVAQDHLEGAPLF